MPQRPRPDPEASRVDLRDLAAALARRMRQQLFDPVGTGSVADVVRRLCAVPVPSESAQSSPSEPGGNAPSQPGEVGRAVAARELIKTFTFRGDLDALASTPASTAVRLLPGHDQWVLGPGTADPHVVPPSRRTLATRKADLVVAGRRP